jgi:hypothetical protein
MNTFQTYLIGDTLPPITEAACSAWDNVNRNDAMVVGPTPSAAGIATILDAVHALETAVIALQGGA